MRLVTRESSKNEPRNELDSLVTRLVSSLHSMSVRQLHRLVRQRHFDARRRGSLRLVESAKLRLPYEEQPLHATMQRYDTATAPPHSNGFGGRFE